MSRTKKSSYAIAPDAVTFTLRDIVHSNAKSSQVKDSICPICQHNYGTDREDDGPLEHPVIVAIPGCNHVFGDRCLHKLVDMHKAYTNKCPLCRTQWFSPNPVEWEHSQYIDWHDLRTPRRRVSEMISRGLQKLRGELATASPTSQRLERNADVSGRDLGQEARWEMDEEIVEGSGPMRFRFRHTLNDSNNVPQGYFEHVEGEVDCVICNLILEPNQSGTGRMYLVGNANMGAGIVLQTGSRG